ncbi:VOC family protein [Luteococcus peritonei]|uniref:VOC family protein n=1 Tax=Luteococcus peritonei TaxID=88874 RepID=A0ABW4RVS1_9ACTN
MATTVQITFDCADPEALCTFWCQALGYRIEEPPQPFTSWPEALAAWGVPEQEWDSRSACSDPEGTGPRFFFQRTDTAKPAKNRIHLDLRTAVGMSGPDRMAALQARAEELVAVGATILQRVEPDGFDLGNIVLADPEGNEFCLD